MRSRTVLGVAALALCAGATVAQAQEDGIEPVSPIEEMREVFPVGYPPAYSPRAVGIVYNNGGEANTNTNGQTQGVCSWGDEMDFTGGPWATAPTRLATQLIVWVQSSGSACPADTTQAYDILVDFWADADHDYTLNPMMTGTPLASLRVSVNGTCGVQTGWIVNLTGLPDQGLLLPTEKVFVQYRLVDVGTTTLRPHPAAGTGVQSNFPVFGIGTSLVGQSTSSYFRDVNANQIANGGTPLITGTGAGHEHRATAAPSRNQRGLLRGEIPPPPIPTNTPLGPVADAGLTANATLGSGEVKWYEFSLNGDATDPALQFLDIDTEGSAITNVSMGLYRVDGTIVGFDHDDGSLNNAQLSYGVGRRQEVPGGLQYDGRNGQLTAGTYYLAVASGNGIFADGFFVSTTATDTGAVQLNFATNTNGAPLLGSVVPIINGTDYGVLDPNAGTASPGAAVPVGGGVVAWSTFELASNVDASHFMDIEFLALSSSAADGACYIFDEDGDIVYYADDEGPGNLPQMSLGAAGSRLYGTNTVPFDGNMPVGETGLAAGTYYMAAALWDTQDLSALASGHRWHVRGISNSNFSLGANIYTGVVNLCGSADFDGDGDTGTDLDIEAFFACLGGDCCALCGSADFDGDGDTGTDLDIESFFRVLGGGEC